MILVAKQQAYPLQFPPQISVAFTLLFALLLQLSPLLLARIRLIPLKHLLKPVADGTFPRLPRGYIRPQIAPGNPCQALFDLVGVQFFRLPPCGGAQGRQPGTDMALPLLPGLGPGTARQIQPLAHFGEHSLAWRTACTRAPLWVRGS